MVDTAGWSKHLRCAFPLVLFLSLTVARPAFSQDDRIDDRPDQASAAAPAQRVTISAPPPAASGLLPEPHALSRTIRFAIDKFGESRQASPKEGFYLEMSNMITGSGWVSLGPGYRYVLADKR